MVLAPALGILVSGILYADPVYDARGFNPNRAFFSQLPFEHIDPFTGNLLLTFTDLTLPGNAGFDLKIQRTYNSKIYKDYDQQPGALAEDSWAGLGWTLHFGRVLQAIDADKTPIIEMPDGSRHPTFHHIAPPPGCGTCFITKEYWIYDRGTRTLRLPNGTTYTFEHSGDSVFNMAFALYATQIVDTFGNSITITYNEIDGPADQITSVTQDLGGGQSRHVTFGVQNHALATMSFEGRVWNYGQTGFVQGSYSGYSLLTAALPPVGPGWTYGYNTAGSPGYELTSLTTPNGGQISYSYEDITRFFGNGRPLHTRGIRQRVIGGRDIPTGYWNYSYFSIYTIVSAPCNTTTYTFRGPQDNVSPAWAFGLQSSMTIEGYGGIESESSYWIPSAAISNDPQALGGVVDPATYTPLLAGRTVIRDGHVGPGSEFGTGYGYSPYNFNDYGRPSSISESGQLNRTTTRTFQYGFSGYLVDKVAAETISMAGESFTKSYSYSSNGFLQSQSIYGVTTSFSSDGRGNVASSTDARFNSTGYAYQWGRITYIQTPEYTISRTINPDGTTASETRRGFTTSFAYDANGRVVQTSPPVSNAIVTAYDNNYGAVLQVSRGGSTVTTYLDGFGRTSGTQNSVGVRTTLAFDACGRRIYESYPFTSSNIGTSFQYDGLSRVKARINPDGTSMTYSYSSIDVTITDESRHTTTQIWKASGDPNEARLAAVTDAAALTTVYNYNALGGLTSACNGRSWSYNSKNQLVAESHPENGTITYERDAVGNMTQRLDFKNQHTNYTYDRNNRLTSIDGSGTLYDTNITYDGSDNRLSVTNGIVSTSYGYDGANRMTSRTDSLNSRSFTTAVSYDGNGNVASVHYPSGRTVSYAYDAGDRPLLVMESGTVYGSQFNYHPSGAIASFQAGNGITHTIAFDNRYRVQSLNAGSQLALTYGYDGVGNVLSIGDTRAGMNQSFGYDSLDRLTSASGFWGSGGFDYDRSGNRKSKSVGGTTTYSYDSGNHLTSATGAGSGSFAYDLNGNQTQDPTGAYTYTQDDMMETATVGGTVTTYRYDADHVRALKVGAGATGYFLHGPRGALLAEYQESCPGQLQLIRDYIYVGDRLLAAVKPVQRIATVSMSAATGAFLENGTAFPAVRLTTSDGGTSSCPVTVQYATSDGTAVAGSDYAATSGVLTFEAGTASGITKSVIVPITNDSLNEDEETFTLTLSNPNGAVLGMTAETVTIIDDDPLPNLSVVDWQMLEGNSGTTVAPFVVELSAASGRPVTVTYETADFTATTADEDYIRTAGTLTFAPGTTALFVVVPVIGDNVYEPDEILTVTLSSPVNANLLKQQGVGTIKNDDLDCTMALDSVSRAIDPGPAAGTVNVTLAMQSCTWTAVSQSTWLTVPQNSGATGNGSFMYSAGANPNPNARTGFVTVGYRRFMLTQAGTSQGTGIRVADTFTGSSGTALTSHAPDVRPAGVTWTAVGGAPTLFAGRVIGGAATGHLVVATLDAGVSDLALGVDWLVGTGTRPVGGLVLRFNDVNNYLLLQYSRGWLTLIRQHGNIAQGIGSQPIPVLHPRSPHRMEARAHGDAIQVLWDGVVQFQVFEPFQANLTRHGIAWYPTDDPESGFDNFALDGENRPPVVINPGNQSHAEASVVSLPISASDPDGFPLTFGASNLPQGLAINPTTGLISGTLTYLSAGIYAVTVSASDGNLYGSQTFTWTVANVNAPPTLTSPGDQMTRVNASVALQLIASDLDGDALTYTAVGLPPSLSVNATTGLITGTVSFASSGRYAVTATVSDGSLSSSQTFTWTVLHPPAGDFDGDYKADMTVFRASTGGWYSLNSSTNYGTSSSFSWGLSTDKPMPGDYDGDGKTDPAVWRASTGGWYILKSSTNYTTSLSISWGLSTDVPVPGDYDGDGKIDPTVYRPSTGFWYILYSGTNYSSSFGVSWGLSTDTPMQADYDGDSKTDPAIFRPSTGIWAMLKSSTNYASSMTVSWGLSTDVAVPGDYDGDGRADPAIFRPSTGLWAILLSSTNYTSSVTVSWGLSADVPVPGDYDGDGRIDPAIFRPSTGLWAILSSSTNYGTSFSVSWGLSTDVPILRRPQ